MSKTKKTTPASIIWFEIPAQENNSFGIWEINRNAK